MTSLLHFEEMVHRKDLARAGELSIVDAKVTEPGPRASGFPEEPHIERRISCTQVLSTERSLYMPISIILQQQEEAADDVQRTHRRESILFQRWRWRWRGAQF